jgi:transcription elongation factor Elf1
MYLRADVVAYWLGLCTLHPVFLCSTNINYLTEPIDIFTEWIDEAEATNAANGHDDDLDDLDA